MVRPQFLLLLSDVGLALCALLLAHVLRPATADLAMILTDGGLFRVLCYLAVLATTSYFLDLFNYQHFNEKKSVAFKVFVSSSASLVILSFLFYVLTGPGFWRDILLLSILLFALLQIGLRLLIATFAATAVFANRILILGTGELARKVAGIVPDDHNPHSYLGFVAGADSDVLVDPESILGRVEDIEQIFSDHSPHLLIIALSERRGHLPLKEIMHSKLRGVEVLEADTYYEQVVKCLMVEEMQPSSFIYTHRFRMTRFMRSYKRFFDIVMSGIGLVIVAPLFPLIALAIRLESKGPVFYRQLRVGEGEVEFFVNKFRTMCHDAEQDGTAVWAKKNDPRVTRVGRFLRKSRLDEIPQLFNVLKGDMSFIGPRPERRAFVERLKDAIPFYSTRH
ncbi:MAG: exopolysaccharide biosynthesis polyprenyl glycosylphosphotransferase, partial [Pelovirga sp.]